jgi:repressor LexA
MPRISTSDDDGYQFIVRYFIQNGRAPSFQAIATALGYASKRSVQLLVGRLRDSGRIKYADGKIDLVFTPNLAGGEQTVPVPIVGSVPCGGLALAEEDIEDYVEISTMLAKPSSRYFILRAKGDSMDLSGIDDGDLVLIRQLPTANDGDRVVALVNGEATIKHFHREKGMVVLRPNSSNPQNKPIFLSEALLIQGIVVCALPRL